MSEETEKKKFKVADNRRFDTAGNEREATIVEVERVLDDAATVDSNKSPQKKPEAATEAKSDNHERSRPGSSSQPQEGLNFSSFVISLATQALIQMGQMEAPAGADVPKDLVAAKQTIDLLAILEDKTKGNLDQAEAQLMEQILHSLRLSYVQAVAK